ncbi:hypothetical protein EG328_001320 [Venturia inaequalis]|uniref:F-box domain-containing protein n=2 Tax=Venturia inaequalis TaxID=5025 RepID=A0A8H3Z9H4_VENIN|nr:hypothetical protein EG328_001320 [Venturia inaequalis]KAE9991150.1 hypothetical protein EG327_000391 [Venturia inaequalis]
MPFQKTILSLASASSSRITFGKYSDCSSSRHSDASSIRSRASSIGSYTTISSYGYLDDTPKLVKTPWETKGSIKSNVPRSRRPASRSIPSRSFEKLPEEVYQFIIAQLEESYFSDKFGTCTTCYMKDLHSLTLTSRGWERASRRKLYSKIWLCADDHLGVTKLTKLPDRRIMELRRSLRDNPALARLVKEIHFPEAHDIYQLATSKDRQGIINNLASLVMACPNLERFSGLYLTYSHTFDRLTHALSTRPRLKEKVWVLKASDPDRPNLTIDDAFLHSHDEWSNLETLCMFGQGSGNMDYRAFAATFRNLPALKHLLISDFDDTQFNDRTLQTIPPLRSLRLQDLDGVTEGGLLKYADSFAARAIESLTFINLEVTSAALIALFMANLNHMTRFTLSQNASPSVLPGSALTAPIYMSDSLEYLHWDVLGYGPSYADLAAAISLGALPSLHTVRAPSDNDGLLQAQCRPSADITLPEDAQYLYVPDPEDTFAHPTLPTARRAAQNRLITARAEPYIKIIVDEDGVVQHSYTLTTYMGTLGSKISYSLLPDVDGSEEAISGLKDLLIRKESLGADSYCFGDRKTSIESDRFARPERSSPFGRRRPQSTYRGHMGRKMVRQPGLNIFF